jgi:hypothetical protein
MRHKSSKNPRLNRIAQCRPNRLVLWAGILVVAIVVGTLSAHLAFSQADATGRFRQFDKNGDGKVTREEAGNAAWFDTLDANRDGVITRLEAASAALSAAKSKLAARLGTHSVQAYRKDSPGPVPVSDSKAFTDLQFTRDWVPGTKDHNGRLMTGTECNYIVAHGGRLYAAVSLWNHDPAAPNPGRGVLVKKSADAPWEVDVQFHPRNVRVPVLASLTFGTDVAGKRLDPPVRLLAAGSGSFVFDPAVTPQAVGGLRSARTVCISPFPEEKGRVIYFGGFDAAQGPHRDTAWIYRGVMK